VRRNFQRLQKRKTQFPKERGRNVNAEKRRETAPGPKSGGKGGRERERIETEGGVRWILERRRVD
jgi:hypothetical protein